MTLSSVRERLRFSGCHLDPIAREGECGLAEDGRRGWLVDLLVGGIVGGVVGAIVAVNFVIYVGIDRGYEASIPDVFQQNVLAGIVTVAILVAGPVAGVVVARRLRARRAQAKRE